MMPRPLGAYGDTPSAADTFRPVGYERPLFGYRADGTAGRAFAAFRAVGLVGPGR